LPLLNARLAKVDADLAGRRNDWVFVVSGHRGSEVGVQPWPLDPARVRCRWKAPSEVTGAAAATKPRILRYHYTHESAMENVLELNLEVPSPMEFPSLEVTLTGGDAAAFPPFVFAPPKRAEAWQQSDERWHWFGRYGDRGCYRIRLPRVGEGMKLRLFGPGWDGNAVGVPQFNGKSLPLAPRVLVFKPVDPALSLIRQLKPFEPLEKMAGPNSVVFDPAEMPTAAGRPVALVVGPLKTPPPSDQSTVEVIVTDLPAKTMGSFTLYREPAYYTADTSMVWVEAMWASGMPSLGQGIDLSGDSHARVYVVSTKEGMPGGPVVFQHDAANRPGHVTVVVPRLTDSGEWPRQRQQMVAFLLAWAGSLAERKGETQAAVTSEVLVPADSIAMLPQESGPPAERAALGRQILDALHGSLNERALEPASNQIGGELLGITACISVHRGGAVQPSPPLK
jgi:hypothetical protein